MAEAGSLYRRRVSSIAAIVLAAGPSERLGYPKQLIERDGRPLLETIVAETLSWPVATVVVVIGAFADEILDAVDFGDAIVAVNEGWTEGVASSVRIGFDVITREPRWDQAFVVLGDQPGVPQAVPEQLIAASTDTQRPAVAPVYRYQRGDPVLFDRSLWPRLMTLAGDTGIGPLLTTHPEWVEEVRFPNLPLRDIDTPEDASDLVGQKRRGTRHDGSH